MSCPICGIVNIDKIHLFNEQEVDNFLYQLFRGDISIERLDVYSYQKVANKLTEGVFKGFGKDIMSVEYNSIDYNMLNALRENVYVFSGAKQYQQVRELTDMLVKDKSIISFNDFKKQALSKYNDYNVNYLSAEYNSAIAQSRSASQWVEIERDKNEYPQLQYDAVNDGRVRPEHAELDGIIRPVGDSFWSKFMPPNGWNCRCDVIQVNDGVDTPKANIPKITNENVPEIFRFNAGKERIVFSDKHPYFQVESRHKDLALNNFNLPLPK